MLEDRISNRDAFESGTLGCNLHSFGAILCEIETDTRLEHPILVQILKTPHVNRVLQHSRVGARTLTRKGLALDPFSKSQSQLLVQILKPQDPTTPQVDLSV